MLSFCLQCIELQPTLLYLLSKKVGFQFISNPFEGRNIPKKKKTKKATWMKDDATKKEQMQLFSSIFLKI